MLVSCFVFSGLSIATAVNYQSMNCISKSLELSPAVTDKLNAETEEFSVYNDAKFQFIYNLKKNSSKNYTVTVTRRDDDFNAYPVQFIYNLIIVSDNRVYTVAKYVLLKPGQKSVTVNETMPDEIQSVKTQSYGIKFPPLTEFKEDNSLMDMAFNLKLKYHDRNWFTSYFRNPHIEYTVERRDHKDMDCNVVLKRAITLFHDKIPASVEWTGFGIEKGNHDSEGTVFGIDGLTGFQTHPDEYYLQFHK